MGEAASAFFSHHLDMPVKLLYIGGNGQREIPGRPFMGPKHARSLSIAVNDKLQPQRIRFADAAPLLITTTASEEDARRRLPAAARGEDVIVRFRPNVHVDVGTEAEAYDEDGWGMLTIRSQVDKQQEVSVRCLFRTVRCLSLNADLAKGGMIATPKQLYGLLAKDRRTNEYFPLTADKPVFGQYACAGPSGAVLRVGDEVEVTDRVSRAITPSSPEVLNGTLVGVGKTFRKMQDDVGLQDLDVTPGPGSWVLLYLWSGQGLNIAGLKADGM
ncbi:hypothetical protein LTR86_003045 [Recurvomyces mirabilis]|nr:hypothetical protein LTR86_003045 [Recurvomyces mirabilis]